MGHGCEALHEQIRCPQSLLDRLEEVRLSAKLQTSQGARLDHHRYEHYIGEKSIGFEDQREGTETTETRLTDEDVPEGPQEHLEYVENDAEDHLEQFEGDNIDDLNDAIRVLEEDELQIDLQGLTPTDSKLSKTLIATRSMSLWVGENLNRRMWEGWYSTATSRGPTPI